MKAQLSPRINLEGRTRLETVIPLSTPYLVFLDPSDICNFQCRFCPTGDRKLIKSVRKPQLMDWRLYQKIIDDLYDMPEPVKTLRLYSDGEPLLNNYLPEMVAYAKSRGRFLSIDTTTNGSLLRPNLNRRLIGAGLDKIFISVNGMNETDYWSFCKYKIDFKRFVKNIRHFYNHREQCQVYIKIAGDNLTKEEKARFFETFGDIADRVFIEHRINCWPNFNTGEDPEVGIYGNPLTDVTVCPYVTYSVKINSDGKVSACFLDYPHKLIIGDLKRESFKTVWNGDSLRAFQIMHLKGERRSHPFCGECHQLTHGCPDNLDPYAEYLLNKISLDK